MLVYQRVYGIQNSMKINEIMGYICLIHVPIVELT